jgi:parallel beta-helix repeat protein
MKGRAMLVSAILFLCMIFPLSAPALSMTSGTVLYVGGSGPGNYTKIQDALDASVNGDTVFVYHGIYQEELWVHTEVRLIGESQNSTFLEVNETNQNNLIFIDDISNITISGFTLQTVKGPGSLISLSSHHWPSASNITIRNNIFYSQSTGIWVHDCEHCVIEHNAFFMNRVAAIQVIDTENTSIVHNSFQNGSGIEVFSARDTVIQDNSFNVDTITNYSYVGIDIQGWSYFNLIAHNTFHNINQAIRLIECSENNITSNLINNSDRRGFDGISIDTCFRSNISWNTVRNCFFGVFIDESGQITVSKNTFLKNTVDARFYGCQVFWNQNYWERSRIFPKLIFGIRHEYQFWPGFLGCDLHPAQAPYDIPNMI